MSYPVKIVLACILCTGACKSKPQTGRREAPANNSTVITEARGASLPDPEGIYMKAVIDGKEWVATRMTPDYRANSGYKMINGESDEYSINFNLYKPKAGDRKELNDAYMIGVDCKDGHFSAKDGEVSLIMADEYWTEGNFHFKATSGNSKRVIEVKDGFFRVYTNNPDR